jgi:hypothetical protein
LVRKPLIAIALCCVLVAAACTSEGDEDVPDEPSVRRVGRFQVGGDCEGFGTPRHPQVSFVLGDELFVAAAAAKVARCALEIETPSDVEWGPEANRLHFGDLRRSDGNRLVSIDDTSESVAWSRPTGTSVVYVSEGRLMKVNAFGSEPFDISFLVDHDEVVYHPAGTHIAVAGTADDGTYGLWLATNVGEEPQLLAIGEDARRIFSLSFAHDGTTLYYAAEHDDRYDVHSLRLALQDEEGRTREAELGTLDSAPTEMGDVVASEFIGEWIAYSVGSCEEKKTTRISRGGSVTELGGDLAGRSTEPVGWLPGGGLVVLAREAGCEGPGTLYEWKNERSTRLAPGVSAAGVRVVLPPPPGPPGSEQQVVA